MTYKELYEKALWDLEHNRITLGEFDRITEPLNKEILEESEEKIMDRNCENCKHHTENGCTSWECEYEPKNTAK